MSFGFFFREALRALKRNAVPSFAAMATVLVTVLILGVFIPMVQATTGAANEVRSKVIADVYMKTNATQADLDRVRKLIETQVPHVGKVTFISKKQALASQREAGRGDYYDLLGSNPLRTRSGSRRTTPTTSGRSATRSRRARPPAAARSWTRGSTRSATARRTRPRSSPSRAW